MPGPQHTQWSPIRTPGRGSGPNWPWRSWSRRRRRRFARTVGVGVALLVLLIIVATQCGSDTTTTTAGPTTTAPKRTTTTVKPVVVTAAIMAKKLPAATYSLPATVAANRIVVVGGLNPTKQSTLKVWSIDPTTGDTQNIAKLGVARHSSSLGVLGTNVFTFGGNTKPGVIDTIDSVSVGPNSVTTVGKLPTPRSEAAGITDAAGPTLYLVGGWNGKDPTNDVLSTVDGVTFQTRAQLKEPVRSPAVTLQGNSLWVFGGQWNDVPSSSIQRIDLSTGAAEVVAKLPAALTNAMAFTIGDTVYLAGGRQGQTRSNEVRRFDPTTFTLTPVTTLQAGLSDAGVAVLGSTAFLVGGLNPGPSSQIITVSVT